MTTQEHESLAQAFRDAAQHHFRFLVDELGFRIDNIRPRGIKYCSRNAYVIVYLNTDCGLNVEFGRPPGPPAGEQPYGIAQVLIERSDKISLPADIQAFVEYHKKNPDQYYRLFSAETPDQVRSTVPRLAELTKQYAWALVKGEASAFQTMAQYRDRATEAWRRRMWLNKLPPEIRSECETLPTDELEQRANEQMKKEILSKYGGALMDIQHLPPNEFVKEYFSRQLKRSRA